MRRGEVWLVDLGEPRGSEAAKRRPALIVSRDGSNRRAAELGRGVVTVVPLTSNVERVLSFQVLLPPVGALQVASKIQVEQIRSIDVVRLVDGPMAVVPADLMTAVDGALLRHLALDS